MTFSILAGYLEKLEETSSRLEMTRVLAQLLGKVGPEEGKVTAYMIQGMLGPKYANPDMGMAEKQVIKAIERLSGQDVVKVFKSEGDLGLTVEKIKLPPFAHSELRRGKQNLVVREVYEKLLEIAKVSGEGSQEKKINLLSDLVTELEPKSAKYAVKMVLGRMRGGFSDMTILDALSWMLTGDKSLRPEIERIYNVRADLGEMVRIIKSQIQNSNSQTNDKFEIQKINIRPEIGTPVLVARAEREKTIGEIWIRCGVSAAEHKLDGLRIEAHVNKSQITLFSRGLENVTGMYPDIVKGLKEQVKENCILDGEMIAVGKNGRYLPFQETVQRKRKYNILEMMAEVPLKYYVFDILAVDGRSMLDEPNEKRWEELTGVLQKGQTVRLMPRRIVKSEKEMEKFFREALAAGTEGMVVKKLDGIYRSGSRDFNWIKYKKSYQETGEADTIDAVVMGYDAGQGKRSGFGVGGFLIGVYDKKRDKFLTIAKIGTGLKDEEWRQLNKKCKIYAVKNKPDNYEVSKQMECDGWIKPEMVVEVKCDEITKSPMHTSGYALRFPRLVNFREIKVEEAATPHEIIRLFELQSKKTKGGGEDGG